MWFQPHVIYSIKFNSYTFFSLRLLNQFAKRMRTTWGGIEPTEGTLTAADEASHLLTPPQIHHFWLEDKQNNRKLNADPEEGWGRRGGMTKKEGEIKGER